MGKLHFNNCIKKITKLIENFHRKVYIIEEGAEYDSIINFAFIVYAGSLSKNYSTHAVYVAQQQALSRNYQAFALV